jgi:hypothetical protein
MKPPLTPPMRAALDHLTASNDLALVRRHSQWWVRESDADNVSAPAVDLEGRLKASGCGDPVTCVPTSTINALVARGLLTFTGAKRRILAAAKTKAHWRAELTPAGRELRADQVDAAAQAAEDLLRKVTTI